MENNNIPEIPTEGEGYKDFNGFKAPADGLTAVDGEQTVAAEPAPEIPTAAAPQYQQAPVYTQQLPQAYYTAPQPQQGKTSPVFGILSIVLGVLGCCCYSVPSIIGLILGIIGVKKNSGRVASIIGIVISALVIAYWVFCIAFMFKNPEILEEYMEQYQEILESAGGIEGMTEALRIFF